MSLILTRCVVLLSWLPWRDDPRYKVAGWTFLGLIILILVIDLIFNQAKWAKTFSQYVTARAMSSWKFMLVVLGALGFLIFHFLYTPIRSWIRRWFGK
jgi:hypothetical protein